MHKYIGTFIPMHFEKPAIQINMKFKETQTNKELSNKNENLVLSTVNKRSLHFKPVML